MQDLVKHRIVIYPIDVSRTTGLAPRTAWNLLSLIRAKHKKTKGQFITASEFGNYTGIPEEEILAYLK
jgi:hypothetical protein